MGAEDALDRPFIVTGVLPSVLAKVLLTGWLEASRLGSGKGKEVGSGSGWVVSAGQGGGLEPEA